MPSKAEQQERRSKVAVQHDRWNANHCNDCARPPLPGLKRCAICREAHNARERVRHSKQKRQRAAEKRKQK
jgi:hypothetical protein